MRSNRKMISQDRAKMEISQAVHPLNLKCKKVVVEKLKNKEYWGKILMYNSILNYN